MTRSMFIALTATLCTLITTQAHADTRVTVHDFYGPYADRVRDDVVNLLERQSGITIVSQAQVESLAERLGVDPSSVEGRIALGRELQLSAWMTGVVKRHSGKLKLTVVVYDGAQHSLVGRTRVTGSSATRLSNEIKDHLWRKSRYAILFAGSPRGSTDTILAGAPTAGGDTASGATVTTTSAATPEEIAAASTAAAAGAAAEGDATPDDAAGETNGEAPAPSETAAASESTHRASDARGPNVDSDSDADDADATADKKQGHGEALRAFLGFGSPYRNLAFTGPISPLLGDYQLSGAPMLDVNVAFHPARLFTDGWASWFGLDLRGQVALSTRTYDRDGNEFSSHYDSYHIGARARFPLGRHYVSVFSGYAMNRVSVTAKEDGVESPTPNVDYRMMRSGAGGEFALTDTLGISFDAALLNILSVGDIGKWFPRASAGGFELAGAATYGVTRDIYARVAVSYQQTFFDFNPRPDDEYAAQGATDQYLAMSLGAGVKL